jgi:hypothetical protein
MDYTVTIPDAALPALTEFTARQPEKYLKGADDFAAVVVAEAIANVLAQWTPPEVAALHEQALVAKAAQVEAIVGQMRPAQIAVEVAEAKAKVIEPTPVESAPPPMTQVVEPAVAEPPLALPGEKP